MDLSSPLDIPTQLNAAWPGSELIVIEGEGHGASQSGISEALIASTDRFAAM
jgi:proline iminopeptidase